MNYLTAMLYKEKKWFAAHKKQELTRKEMMLKKINICCVIFFFQHLTKKPYWCNYVHYASRIWA